MASSLDMLNKHQIFKLCDFEVIQMIFEFHSRSRKTYTQIFFITY